VALNFNLKMTKSAKLTITVSKDTLQWQHDAQSIAYPIFIRDPGQQHQFLSATPPLSTINLNFDKALCSITKTTFFGKTIPQIIPEKIILITLTDIFTRHSYKVGTIHANNHPIYHWASPIIGQTAWILGSIACLIGLTLLYTHPPKAPPKQQMHTANGIPTLLLQKLAELPGAIAETHITQNSGRIRAYIPLDQQEAFSTYINQKSPQFPTQWQHHITGKTKHAFIWEGQWEKP
jgi:hypothetical protein